MNILFSPPTLAREKNAETLTRVFERLTEPEGWGELRVNERMPGGSIRLILIGWRRPPASIMLPPGWLKREIADTDIQDFLEQLLHPSSARR